MVRVENLWAETVFGSAVVPIDIAYPYCKICKLPYRILIVKLYQRSAYLDPIVVVSAHRCPINSI